MNATHLLSAAALALVACQTGGTRKERAVPVPASVTQLPAHQEVVGKQQAPVTIEAELSQSTGRVLVRFAQAGTNVNVHLSGVEGLTLLGEPALATGRSVAAGEVLAWDVPLQPGPGQSMLVVRVSGSFGARERATVRAFPIGLKAEAQLRRAHEGETHVGGEAVKLLPARETKK